MVKIVHALAVIVAGSATLLACNHDQKMPQTTAAPTGSCKGFLQTGGQYQIEYTTTSGPSEIGRVQKYAITNTRTTSDGECSAMAGTMQTWAMDLKACETLSLRARSVGNSDLTGEASCAGNVATGTMNYVDGARQTWGYSFRLTRY